MNPFLSKPLRKVQPPANVNVNPPLKNASVEHRPSRFLNQPKKGNQDKRGADLQKSKNLSPKKQPINNINIISKFSKENDKKNSLNIKSERPNENEQRVNNPQKMQKDFTVQQLNKMPKEYISQNLQKEITLQQLNKIPLPKENTTQKLKKENTLQQLNKIKKESNKQIKNAEKNENIVKTNDSNLLLIENNINISFHKSQLELNKLVFNNNDEIFEYLRKQIKDGKIKDIKSKLEIPSSDFTGFTISKKKQGYTIYEIELVEDIEKVNEIIKNQKVEIGKRPIQIVFLEQMKTIKKEMETKGIIETKKPETLIHAMKNRTMEREMEKVKKDVINDEIKILQNKIHKQKAELRNAENENDYIRKEIEKKSIMKAKLNNKEEPKKMDSGVKVKIKDENDSASKTNEKEEKKTIEDNQKKANRALARFKKAYSHKAKDDAENVVNKPPENSGKIQSLAAILQEHIIKPLAEMRAENNDMRPRGGSVECRMIKNEGMAEILANAPMARKNVKKPKIAAFE